MTLSGNFCLSKVAFFPDLSKYQFRGTKAPAYPDLAIYYALPSASNDLADEQVYRPEVM